MVRGVASGRTMHSNTIQVALQFYGAKKINELDFYVLCPQKK